MLFNEVISVPLEMEQLKKVLEQKGKKDIESPELIQNIMFKVDYTKSELKDQFFINYIANLKLSVDIETDGLLKEDKFKLIKLFLQNNTICEIHNIKECVAAILLEAKADMSLFPETIFLDSNERMEFFNENKEEFEKWMSFYDSIMYTLPFCVEDYSKDIGKELIDKQKIKIVSDPNAIGKNIVLPITMEGFLENYINLVEIKKDFVPTLYECQWFEPLFNGTSLMNVMVQYGSLFPFMVSLFEGWNSYEELEEVLKVA